MSFSADKPQIWKAICIEISSELIDREAHHYRYFLPKQAFINFLATCLNNTGKKVHSAHAEEFKLWAREIFSPMAFEASEELTESSKITNTTKGSREVDDFNKSLLEAKMMSIVCE